MHRAYFFPKTSVICDLYFRAITPKSSVPINAANTHQHQQDVYGLLFQSTAHFIFGLATDPRYVSVCAGSPKSIIFDQSQDDPSSVASIIMGNS